jgi:hypothetical protein
MTSKEIRELKKGEKIVFKRQDLKKVRSYIQGKKGYLIVMLPEDYYKLERTI